MERAERVLEGADRRWRAVEAWRSGSGRGLVYFLPLEASGEEAAPDDREDRRAALEPGETLDELTEPALRERLGAATPLTDTERRFRAPDGRLWLVQSVGPVWADDVASGLTGLLFTALEGADRRAETAGGHVGRMDAAELERRWRRAVEGPAEEREEAGPAPATAAADGGADG